MYVYKDLLLNLYFMLNLEDTDVVSASQDTHGVVFYLRHSFDATFVTTILFSTTCSVYHEMLVNFNIIIPQCLLLKKITQTTAF